MKNAILAVCLILLNSCHHDEILTQLLPAGSSDLKFTRLATVWDEAIPLGNGMLGALVWEKNNKLRFSLDRADLWDLRPMENLDRPEWKFSWVREQWEKNNYAAVQNMFDAPYDRNPAPSKIPGGAMEFDISAFGEVQSVELRLIDALCVVKWRSGIILETFVDAQGPVGWFRLSGAGPSVVPEFIAPAYNIARDTGADNSHSGQDLRLLGYPEGKISGDNNSVTYNQKGWRGFRYQVNIRWQNTGKTVVGCWSISSEYPGEEANADAAALTLSAMKSGYGKAFADHGSWWMNFWKQSGISLPDSSCRSNGIWRCTSWVLQQATEHLRSHLQAVWTADNGKLPPWKGDFHHDLNTQLSYWPSYSSNHLTQEAGFINWLEKNKPEFEKYTRQYFQVSGLNVPGVTTLTGQPMGGWIQYSFGPTVSSWLAHHFYLHWRYSMDREFLEKEAYPWIQGGS